MVKDVICVGCKKGPCLKKETDVRPVLTDYHKSCYPSSDLWRQYDFTRVYQCLDTINSRNDIFQCDYCGFYFENHMLHTQFDGKQSKYLFCPDCYEW